MERFNYDIYDYSKIGINPLEFYNCRLVTQYEMKALKSIVVTDDEAVSIIRKSMETELYRKFPYFKNNPNVKIYYKIVAPGRDYTFVNETSYPKKKSRGK